MANQSKSFGIFSGSGGGGGGGSITINNQANTRLITCTGTSDTLDAESTLTFDGTTLNVDGEMRAEQVYVNMRFTGSPVNGNFLDGSRLARGLFTSGSVTGGTIYYLGSASMVVANASAVATASGLLAVGTDSGSPSEMLLEGAVKVPNNDFSSATKGDVLYLSTTSGRVTATAPSSAGEVVRVVGYVLTPASGYIYWSPDKNWVEI